MSEFPASLDFQGTRLSIVDHQNQPWLTAQDVARALGYAHAKKIHALYERHKAEFTNDMQGVTETVTPSGRQMTRIFSARGCHLLAMFARTQNAAAFRRWVLDVLEGCVLAPAAAAVAPADRVLTDSAYRLEAQQFAQSTLDQYRALLPAGVPAPAWDLAAERRLADGLLAAALAANRWLMSVDHNQRLQLSPVPRESAVIDPKNPEAMATIMNEYVPVELLPQLVQIGVERLARLARQAGKADGRALIPQRDHNPVA